MDSKIPPVRIGFYDPFSVYEALGTALSSKIHLTNVHWRKNSGEPLRAIASLPVSFVEETPKSFDNHGLGAAFSLDSVPSEQRKGKAIAMLKVPYVRAMLLKATDIDSYRDTTRPLIKEWIKSNIDTANGPVEWYLIFHSDGSKAQSRLFDKLKTDFDTDIEADRCIHIRESYDSASHEHELWGSICLSFKQSVLACFTKRLEILSSGLQDISRNILHNFNLYLTLKEGICTQLLALHLFDDALSEFDDLSTVVDRYKNNTDLFPTQVWDQQSPSAMESYMTQPSLFLTAKDSPSLYEIKCFIFSKVFTILEALSDTAPSLSISSLHVSEFLRRLQNFVHDISRSFSDNEDDAIKLDEWVYMIINDVMSLDICAKMATVGNDETGDANNISERFGELLLLQRSKLLRIGEANGYHIKGVLTDIMMTVPRPHVITYEPLKTVLASEKAFQDHFIILTETAINHFGISNRPRTVDALSIDIALLDYENKQYEKAAIVLSTCPEFYGSQGWDVIAYSLLEAYIDCIEHMDECANFFVASDEAIAKEELLSQCYIGALSSLKTNESTLPSHLIKKAVDYLSDYSQHISKEQSFEVENFLSISPGTSVDSASDDTYSVTVTSESKIPYVVCLKDVKLILENESGDTIEFQETSVNIAPGKFVIKMSTTTVQFGTFTLATFAAKLGPIAMVQVFEGEEKKTVDVFPVASNLRLSLGTSTDIDLNVKPVSIFVDTTSEITDVALRLWRQAEAFAIDEGVVVKVADGTRIKCAEVTEELIKIESLESEKRYEVIVPFTTPENPKQKEFQLYASISYKLNGSARQQIISKSVDPALSIAVSVRDIFKSSGLYSRFTIGAAEPESPVRIISADLQSSECFEVGSPLKPGPMIAFGDQPGNYFFKIVSKNNPAASKEEYLTLKIVYREIKEEMSQLWRFKLLEELRKEKLEHFVEILCHISSSLQFDHTEYVLANKLIPVGPKRLYNDGSRTVPQDTGTRALEILQRCVDFGVDFVPGDMAWQNKELRISVLIPSIEVIHTVELNIAPGVTHVALGDQLAAKLEMSSLVSTRADRKNEQPSGKKRVVFEGEQSTINKYGIEILPNQDSWLINGKTRFITEVDKSDPKLHEFPSVPLSLIPLKVGKLALPKIKIKNLNMNSKNEYLMEVDYKNESETINVISSSL